MTAKNFHGYIGMWVSIINLNHNTGEVTAGRQALQNLFSGMADDERHFSFYDKARANTRRNSMGLFSAGSLDLAEIDVQ